MVASEHRILTTHAGSLPRPAAVVSVLERQQRGEVVSPEEFSQTTGAAVRDVVSRQLESGIDIGNNGEVPRASFATYAARRIRGLGGKTRRPWPDCVDFPDFGRLWAHRAGRLQLSAADPPDAHGVVEYHGLALAEAECDQLLSCTDNGPRRFAECFATAVSPGQLARMFVNAHYESHERYLFAIAAALRREYELIHAKGLVLQVDAPDLAAHRAWFFHDRPLATFLAAMEADVAALNVALARIPRDRVRLHVCWANFEAPHVHDVELGDILPLLYQANVGALAVEMANPRHQHEYREFRRHPLPDDMLLIAGVIDSKTNYVEHPEVVAARIIQTATAVGDRHRIIAGVDCGFATVSGYAAVAESVVWRKLQSLRAGAERASRHLWS